MKKFGIYSLCFLLGFTVGYLVLGVKYSFNNSDSDMEMSSDDMSSMSDMPAHVMIEIDPSLAFPAVAVEVVKDGMDGYNLHLTTENFTFTPEKINMLPVPNEGHAHVYVNNVKVSRLYGEWFHLPSKLLDEGDNMIMVTLNANNHSEWAFNNQHISYMVSVVK